MRRLLPLLALPALALPLAACGGGGQTKTVTVRSSVPGAADVAPAPAGRFDPRAIYRREAPGVVTVISVFPGGSLQDLLGGGGGGNQEGLGSGFVLDGKGEIATNAHVVTTGQGSGIRRAKQVYVQFADDNEVPAHIVGYDPYADVALIRVDPAGLHLRPLPLGSDGAVRVGDPVAAIGSPFGEAQSLSTGVVSGLRRTIDSLAGDFAITGAIQTDAAINHGNSGGPLVAADGSVLGINSQIQSTGGGGEGVGFAVPVDLVKRSLAQLRASGHATYAYLGVTTAPVYPQLAHRFGLPTTHGAWVQSVTSGSPAAKAGVHGGGPSESFQARSYETGGDVITAVDGRALRDESDLSEVIARHAPGQGVT
ncbi:MAG TPA: trypsin-like peptidase domain-containing protein, partial [Solirubrobacteraceae bacterium]